MKNYILIGLILSIVLISGCVQTDGGGTAVMALKSFTSPSGERFRTPNQEIFEPVALQTGGQDTHISLEFELLEQIVEGEKIKLTLEDGLEYVGGPFTKSGNDYFIFLERQIVPQEETLQSFTIGVTKKGKHKVRLTVLDENDELVETRFINICVADNADKAVEICTDPGCQTKECIEEKLGEIVDQE